jgi:hypothetical protein
MGTPQTRIRLGRCDVLLLGTIPGFVPDGARVSQAFDAFHPDAVALGVPPEDLPALDSIAEHGPPEDLPGLDDATEKLMELLKPFGDTRIPSPDFEVAHARARKAGLPLEAIDMDDASHSALFTKSVKFHHVVQSNGIKGRLIKKGVSGADAYEIADTWDAAWSAPKGLRRVEEERENFMARRIQELAAGASRLLVVLASPRLAGIVQRLGNLDDGGKARAAQ